MRYLAALLTAALLTHPMIAQEKKDKVSVLLEGAYLGSVAADAITTRRGLQRGLRELNPLVPNHPTAGPVIAAAWSAAGFVIVRRMRGKHPRLAKAILVIGIVAHGLAAGMNERQRGIR